jgi:hypothetical protein
LFEIDRVERPVMHGDPMQSMSIHIGLDQVDPQRYEGWRGALPACEADARAMAALAEGQGIVRRTLLLTADATYDRVMAELATAAAMLRSGDYVLLTFAGHGASFERIETPMASDPGGQDADDPDARDGRDEAWCLYDTWVLDDELHDRFCRFAAGVRICVVSDSCFSGTVTRDDQAGGSIPARRSLVPQGDGRPVGPQRRMAPRLARALYRRDFASVYQPRSLAVVPSRNRQPGAHVVLLAACEDHQTAGEGNGHGLFTEQLLATWNGGRYAGSHQGFVDQIKAAMPPRQRPCLFESGERIPGFVNSRPFTPPH